MSENEITNPPPPPAKKWWRTWWLAAPILIALAVAGGVYLFLNSGAGTGTLNEASSSGAPPPPPQTEEVFVAQHVDSVASADVLAEWRAARGDHKIIAYAIARCEGFRKEFGDIDTMPRRAFSGLMLDLTPLGDHTFHSITAAAEPKQTATRAVAANRDATSEVAFSDDRVGGGFTEAKYGTQADVAVGDSAVKLTSYQQAVLYLSDAIARARLAAAAGASSNYPQMRLLGWITVGLSATATLLVTIKSSMTAPPTDNSQSRNSAEESGWVAGLRRRGLLPSRYGFRRFVFVFVGLLAMVLSAGVTALTSVKQFYDPTTAYKASEVALIRLKQLHKQVALDFVRTWEVDGCKENAAAGDWKAELKKQADLLADYEAAVVAAAATLQQADFSRLETSEGNSGVKNPGGTPVKLGDNAPPAGTH